MFCSSFSNELHWIVNQTSTSLAFVQKQYHDQNINHDQIIQNTCLQHINENSKFIVRALGKCKVIIYLRLRMLNSWIFRTNDDDQNVYQNICVEALIIRGRNNDGIFKILVWCLISKMHWQSASMFYHFIFYPSQYTFY